ncbi:MAG: UDP-N-acetylglucosamine--N-acetylmuramyl-(pentapeptide) pyrophosphoryl-undecaprenol N-acetylglucosamine transferase [Anaerolineae bacterium]|nr:UDP-N-acetylglucosamine--N-acetylmuramyl-(pentapeptide) pyrophosphoryl-undecaprenol N-acetylglucosamine transferase [Anaerolineae bacterium]
MRIMISGGGTGGGVYPALAVAAALKAKARPSKEGRGIEVELLWIGSRCGPERNLVTREGIDFEAVPSGPLAGLGLGIRFVSALKIIVGTIKAAAIVWRFRPQALFITGGWVTIPAALACWLSWVPVMIYTPDTEPGGTIRILSRVAARVGINTAGAARYYRPGQVVETGYPLRAELLLAAGYNIFGQPLPGKEGLSHLSGTRKQAQEYFNLSPDKSVLLIFGGSTGARGISRVVMEQLPQILASWQVLHLVGQRDWEWVKESAGGLSGEAAGRYHPYEYLHSDEMALALAAADLVISRAGASILGEFPLFELPAILVPYPHAWRYQKTNADVLAARGAAVRVDEVNLQEELLPLLEQLRGDVSRRKHMVAASGAMKKPDAAAKLADELIDLACRHVSS